MGKGMARKSPGVAYDGDENCERGNWSGRMDFLLSTIGYAVGLGNIWRFPYKAYANGGATFLIPYVLFLVAAGLPLFFLELSFGQFASLGPISVWNVVPFFKGIGWAMVIVSILVSIYYNMIIAYSLYYLFASMAAEVPWQHCRDEWTRINASGKLITCVERTENYTQDIAILKTWCDANKGSAEASTEAYLYNCSAKMMTPAAVYWEREVLDMSSGIDEGGDEFRWQLVLCLLGAWILIFFCMFKGIKSTGKVVYFTAIFPYVVLIILCIRNALLPGALKGIRFYVEPDLERLKDINVWYAAATQIFYSLGVSFGGLMTMSSYNRFHNNVYRDAILVTIINCATSIFGGFVIFSVLGYMSEITGLPVGEVADDGPGLAFVAYPEGIATMPIAPLWSILFFLMLLTLGVDSLFAMMETVVTAITDEFNLNRWRHGKTLFTLFVCVALFLLGLPQCTRAGVYVMTLFDWYSGSFAVIVIGLLEVVAISWIYGFHNFKSDIQMMVGYGKWINASFYYYWFPTWLVITPVALLLLLVYAAVAAKGAQYGGEPFPGWADAVGWLMVALPLAAILIVGLVQFCRAANVCERLFRPGEDWGPALDRHRAGGRYVPSYINAGYDPSGDTPTLPLDKKYRSHPPSIEITPPSMEETPPSHRAHRPVMESFQPIVESTRL